MTHELAGRTVLAVFAHPDDEALACGGTLARLADAGARVVLVCASRGELGSVSDPSLVQDGDVGAARARELAAAGHALGVAEVVLLSHPDGYLQWDEAAGLDRDLEDLLARYRPDAVITFDADGLYWHGDHIGVHERVTRAVAGLGEGGPPLYYVSLPPGAVRGLAEDAHARGGAPPGEGLWGISPDAFGHASPKPSFRVDVGAWSGRKLDAIRCHRTQAGPQSPFNWIGEEEALRWLGIEHFRRAPGAAPGERVLEVMGEPMEVS